MASTKRAKRKADKLKRNRADRERKAQTAQKHGLGAHSMDPNQQQEPGLAPANQNLDSVEQEAIGQEATTEATEQVETTEPGVETDEQIAEPGQTQAIPAEPTNESAIDEPNTL